MSRVGKRVLRIPEGVKVDLSLTNHLKVSGPLGVLEASFSPLISINIDEQQVTTHRSNEAKTTKQLHGTTNSLICSMLQGVTKYFERVLLIKGVGYRASLNNNVLELLTGYSHPVRLSVPSDLKVEVAKPTEIKVMGCSKQSVGQFSAKIRMVRKPNPHSGKGIAYQDEKVRRKEGKKASK